MTTTRVLAPALAGLLLLLTSACSGTPGGPEGPDASAVSSDRTAPTELPEPGPGLSRMILVGDSVAAGQALPLGAALGASDVEFHSMASDGGGTVVGPVSEELWDVLPDRIATAKPSTVVYQLTTYDWGSEQEQQAAYERLLSTVTSAGATLVFVTMPPIEPDDFYAPHMDELAHAASAARTVADASGGAAVLLDASEVWGDTYEQTRDGVADRSSDGIHTCPQGAARFTTWLLDELSTIYPDYTPPAPQEWANTGWAADDRFVGCAE
ncbi:SGNH/GDSL hydrolase family protein [Actinotalea subterranea]|uniref:SGNH/GDSL hydrolase family protein n=1 Tax=Actinotalea subterranea TaxID=2607497 RepID=UPI0011F0237C|nr:SGNH/GDSL hydrolase family protein [Actinotalea subterranea]